MRHWSAENQNSDGKQSPVFVTLSCTYKAASMHLNLAVQWVNLCKSMG